MCNAIAQHLDIRKHNVHTPYVHLFQTQTISLNVRQVIFCKKYAEIVDTRIAVPFTLYFPHTNTLAHAQANRENPQDNHNATRNKQNLETHTEI